MMKKPQRKNVKNAVYDYGEIRDYIEYKYSIQTRGYKRDLDGQYRDFWRWLVDTIGPIGNGSYFLMPCDDRHLWPWWVEEIMQLFEAEFFPEGESREVYVWW